MTELVTELTRPRGRYGVDGDYRLIPAPVIFGGYLLLCLAAAVFAGQVTGERTNAVRSRRRRWLLSC